MIYLITFLAGAFVGTFVGMLAMGLAVASRDERMQGGDYSGGPAASPVDGHNSLQP